MGNSSSKKNESKDPGLNKEKATSQETIGVREASADHHRTVLIVGFNRSGKSTLCNGLVNAPLLLASPTNGAVKMSNTTKNTEYLVNYKGRTFKIVDTPDIANVENTLSAICGSWKRTTLSQKERLQLCSVIFTTIGKNDGHFMWIARILQAMDPYGFIKVTVLFRDDLATPISSSPEQYIKHLQRVTEHRNKTIAEIERHLKEHGIELPNLEILPNTTLIPNDLYDGKITNAYNVPFLKKIWEKSNPKSTLPHKSSHCFCG